MIFIFERFMLIYSIGEEYSVVLVKLVLFVIVIYSKIVMLLT